MLINELNQPDKYANKILYGNNDAQISGIINFIKKNCSEYLSQSPTGKPLYRGIRNMTTDHFIGKSVDRTPVGGFDYWQLLCDYFLAIRGFTALRNDSVFCSPNIDETSMWGKPYLIYPINGFIFTYSEVKSGIPAMSYLWPDKEKLENKIDKWERDAYNSRIILNSDKEQYFYDIMADMDETYKENLAARFVQLNGFNNTNLRKVFNLDHDIWINGKYVAIKFNEQIYSKFRHELAS